MLVSNLPSVGSMNWSKKDEAWAAANQKRMRRPAAADAARAKACRSIFKETPKLILDLVHFPVGIYI